MFHDDSDFDQTNRCEVDQMRVHRHPVLYLVGLVELLVLHFILCYPAAIDRGFPPLEPFWRVAMVLAFLGIGLLPAVDDFSYKPWIRRSSLVGFGIASSIISGAATANLGSDRPSIGHLAGYPGLFRYCWSQVLFMSIWSFALALPFVFFWELICGGGWNRIRRFSSPAPTSMRVRDLMLVILSIGILGGTIRFLIRLDPYYFSRPFFVE